MSDKLYKVMFYGDVTGGQDIESVKQALAALYKTDVSKVAHFFSGKPVTIKKNVDYDTAVRFVQAFEKAGAVARVEAAEEELGLDLQSDVFLQEKRASLEKRPAVEPRREPAPAGPYGEPAPFGPAGRPSDITEQDFRAYVGQNSDIYLPKFLRFRVENMDAFALTWHWPAFFVGFWWLLYRKLYLWALVAFVCSLIPYVNFLAWIAWPVTGNYIYYLQAKRKILEIKAERPHNLPNALAAVGGVNGWVWPVAIGLTVLGFLLTIAAIYFLSQSFRM